MALGVTSFDHLHVSYKSGTQVKFEGHSKSSKTNSKKKSEYGNQIESCKYSHLIWLPYSQVFVRICLRTF